LGGRVQNKCPLPLTKKALGRRGRPRSDSQSLAPAKKRNRPVRRGKRKSENEKVAKFNGIVHNKAKSHFSGGPTLSLATRV